MLNSTLLNTLLNSGLPGHGYTLAVIASEEREAAVAAILDADGIVREDFPSLTVVASEEEQTVRLITQPGHFAHPSILERRLVLTADGRSIAVSATTCAAVEVAARWVEQFMEQDRTVHKASNT